MGPPTGDPLDGPLTGEPRDWNNTVDPLQGTHYKGTPTYVGLQRSPKCDPTMGTTYMGHLQWIIDSGHPNWYNS